MKTTTTTVIAAFLIIGSTISTATAGNLTADREARTAHIEALMHEVAHGRLTRSEKILAKLQLARWEAEIRKERRQANRMRDRQAALNRR